LGKPEDFVCIAVLRGAIELGEEKAGAGALLLVPPATAGGVREVAAVSDAEWLEIRLP
jgi:hypothetical protein